MKKKRYIVPTVTIVELPIRRLMVVIGSENVTVDGGNSGGDGGDEEDPNGARRWNIIGDD